MRTIPLTACLAVFAMLVVPNNASPAGAGAPAGKVKPLMTLTGPDSGVREKAHHRVSGDEQWSKLWASHRGPDLGRHPRPQVDFDRCVLVAVFRGAASNTSALELDSVTETADAVVLRFAFPGYATGVGAEPHDDAPFGFILLPKTDKPIVLEQDVGERKPVHVPEWREVARLAASDK